MILTPEVIKQALLENECEVEFTKKDGSVRVMKCTLKSDLVGTYEKKTEKVKEVNEEVCPVYDLEKKEWRSFRFDSVTCLTI